MSVVKMSVDEKMPLDEMLVADMYVDEMPTGAISVRDTCS